MKSRLQTLSMVVVIVLFLTENLFAPPVSNKEITFQYISDSGGGFPMVYTDYQYEFWTSDAMGGESPHSTSVQSGFIDPMAGGVSVTFDIGATPVSWLPNGMPSQDFVYLKVTDPMGPETKIFSGSLNQNGDPQFFDQDYSLPVELVSFTVSEEDHVVLLRWETASEVDNAGFNIYRSPDFKGDYQLVNHALIRGAGNTSAAQKYSFKDENVQFGQTYYYKLESVDIDGDVYQHGPIAIAVGESELNLPDDYALSQNYPNPFNPVTTIKYSLPEVSNVELSVFDMRGRLINQLVNKTQDAGIYRVQWNSVRNNGEVHPSGVYFYQLKTGYYNEIKKMFLIK